MDKQSKEILESFKQYLELERSLAPDTLKQNIRSISKFLSFFKNKPIAEISTGDIRAYLAFHKKNKIWNKSNVFSREITLIKSFFKFLKNDKIITDNPAEVIKLPPKNNEKEIKYLKRDELIKIKRVLATSRFTNMQRAIFYMLISTGMRISELLRLTKDDSYINIEERKIFLVKTKTRRPHYIMFSEEAKYYLKLYLIEDQLSTSKYLFHEKNGKVVHRSTVWKMVNGIIQLAFPYKWDKPRGPHILRHTFATDWVSSGGNLIGLQSIMGWHSLKMTEVYVHQSEELVTKAYEDYEKNKRKKERQYGKESIKTI
jgi:integrase/recombinase XerD